jgi:hypothetical protein
VDHTKYATATGLLAGFLAGGIYQGVSGDSSLYVVNRYTEHCPLHS